MVLSLCVKLFNSFGSKFYFFSREVFVCWPVCFGFFVKWLNQGQIWLLDHFVLDAGQQLNSGDLFCIYVFLVELLHQ